MPKTLPVDPSIVRQAHAVLFDLYPTLFDLTTPVPLKRGIHRDILARHPMPARFLRSVLNFVVHQPLYFERCIEGVSRYGFDGPDGVVTKADQKYAKEWIKTHKKRAARAAQEVEAKAGERIAA